MPIWQKERDICYMYRHAKNPAEQIKILAEINACSAEKIKDVLKRNGLTPAEPTKHKRSRQRAENWTVDDLVQLLVLDESGMPKKKLAEHFERTERSVYSAISKIRTEQTATAREALKIYNRQRRGNTA